MSSVAAPIAIPFQAYYSASKSAVRTYSLALANEVRPFGIEVVVIMTMQMSVDELDVSNVKAGQSVVITSDAVENATYSGTVTSVGIEGTTSGGVTTYPVTIRIDKTDGLLPGMNVDAKIVVQSSSDALAVPVSAVVRGNTVLVQKSGKATAGEVLQANSDGLPDGFEYVEVTLGVSDDDYIEVKSGLSEGDIIAVQTVSSDTGNSSSSSGGMRTSRPPSERPFPRPRCASARQAEPAYWIPGRK